MTKKDETLYWEEFHRSRVQRVFRYLYPNKDLGPLWFVVDLVTLPFSLVFLTLFCWIPNSLQWLYCKLAGEK